MDENKNTNEEMLEKMKEAYKKYKKHANDKVNEIFNKDTIDQFTNKVEGVINNASNQVQDGFDNVNVEQAVRLALKAPGTIVNREKFLRDVFKNNYGEEIVELIVLKNPAFAQIEKETIDEMAKAVMDEEITKVTAISASTSLIGGTLLSATVDLSQYFIYLLKTMQKLAYLYGFSDLELNNEEVDENTMNLIMVFLGVMFDVDGADKGLSLVAQYEAKNVAKELAQKSMSKGAIYPIVKEVIQVVGVKITKQVFADGLISFVPVVGAIASGGMTYVTFKPCIMRLQKSLQGLCLSDPASYK